jgi:hypothetical protein
MDGRGAGDGIPHSPFPFLIGWKVAAIWLILTARLRLFPLHFFPSRLRRSFDVLKISVIFAGRKAEIIWRKSFSATNYKS